MYASSARTYLNNNNSLSLCGFADLLQAMQASLFLLFFKSLRLYDFQTSNQAVDPHAVTLVHCSSKEGAPTKQEGRQIPTSGYQHLCPALSRAAAPPNPCCATPCKIPKDKRHHVYLRAGGSTYARCTCVLNDTSNLSWLVSFGAAFQATAPFANVPNILKR